MAQKINLAAISSAIENAPNADVNFGEMSDIAQEYLDRIETQLMKRGTLYGDEVDWEEIQTATLGLFKECRHIKGYLACVLLTSHTPVSAHLSATVNILTNLVSNAWPNLHPTSTRAKKLKETQLQEMISALAGQITATRQAEREIKSEVISQLHEAIHLINSSATTLDLAEVSTALTQSQTSEARPKTSHSSSVQNTKPKELDAKGRAELRRDIKSLADRVFAHDPNVALSYAMRSYAAWLEHWHECPNSNGRIEQHPLPANIQDEHANAVQSPDLTSIQRLEDRLYNSPDWMEGHKHLYDMLQKLGYSVAAQSVLNRVCERLQRMPQLNTLQYANGKPIVVKEISKWAQRIEAVLPETENDLEREEQDQNQLDNLRAIDHIMAQAQNNRTLFSAQLDMVNELLTLGLVTQALRLIHALEKDLDEVTLRSWDPVFFENLQSLKEKALGAQR